MKCPLCQTEMGIWRTHNVVENDDTPNEETKLYIVQELSCLRKECENYQKIVDTLKTELPIG